MEKKKILYIPLILFALIGIIVFSYFTVQREVEKTKPRPPLPKPIIPDYIKEDLPITLSVTEDEFDFPSKVSLLTITPKPISENEVKKLGSNLNFIGDPKIFKDVREGNKYFWSDKTSFFIVTPKTNTIKYGTGEFPTAVTNKQLSDADIIRTAQEFLTGNSIISKDEVKATTIKFLRVNSLTGGFEETSKEEAAAYQVNFTYQTSEYEILTLSPSEPLIYIQVLPDGSIFYAQVIKLGAVLQTEEKYNLKSYEDIANSLNEAVLVGLLNDYISIPDLTISDIKSLDISKISLVYLLDTPATKTLQPVYLLEGEARVPATSVNYGQLYLPAIKAF